MTQENFNYAEIMPKWLGEPMYPFGLPIGSDNYSYDGNSILKIYCAPRGVEDRKVAAAWVDYYVQAPIWAMDKETLQKILAAASVTEKIQLCLEIGLDPF
jgi:hypothetical protein